MSCVSVLCCMRVLCVWIRRPCILCVCGVCCICCMCMMLRVLAGHLNDYKMCLLISCMSYPISLSGSILMDRAIKVGQANNPIFKPTSTPTPAPQVTPEVLQVSFVCCNVACY